MLKVGAPLGSKNPSQAGIPKAHQPAVAWTQHRWARPRWEYSPKDDIGHSDQDIRTRERYDCRNLHKWLGRIKQPYASLTDLVDQIEQFA